MTIALFIAAIALVESGNNPKAGGKAGELSEYQITRRVWWHPPSCLAAWPFQEAKKMWQRDKAQQSNHKHTLPPAR